MAKDDKEVVIVGVGQTDFRALYQNKDTSRDAFGLAAEALKLAIDDAGIAKSEIDGLITSWVDYQRFATVADLGEMNVVYDLQGAGRMSGVAVQQAAALLKAGEADMIALVYGNNGRSVKMSYGGGDVSPLVAYDAMYGMTSAGAEAATSWRRYQHLYSAPDGALAPLAINNRRNAAKNPVAVMQSQFTEDEYLASRFVAEPLRLFDYCIINDGGVALIMTTMERARSLRKQPVKLAATASRGDLWNFYASRDFFFEASQSVAKRVYERSGFTPDDIDVLEIYDNFTPTILFSLEGFNHVPRGEGWRYVQGGERIALDGEKPINTAGGHTGESYMQGWSHHVEAVRQVRGEAGERQVPGADVVQYMASTPITSSHIFVGA